MHLAPSLSANRLPASRALRWLRDGIAVWRVAPVRLTLLAALPIVVEALCQAIPTAGIALSKALTPIAAAYALLLLDAHARTGRFQPSAVAVRAWRGRRTWPALAAIGLATFAFQLAVAAGLSGVDQALAVARGDLASLRMDRLALGSMLASGLLPGVLLVFAIPRMVVDGIDARAALAENARLLATTWRPVVAAMLATAALLAGALWHPALLLVMLPLCFVTGYAMYRDLFPPA